jgi:cell wall-associated NlpC family hydrolase
LIVPDLPGTFLRKKEFIWQLLQSCNPSKGNYKKLKHAEPGDLVFFGPPLKIDHVGIVTQNKKGKLL